MVVVSVIDNNINNILVGNLVFKVDEWFKIKFDFWILLILKGYCFG